MTYNTDFRHHLDRHQEPRIDGTVEKARGESDRKGFVTVFIEKFSLIMVPPAAHRNTVNIKVMTQQNRFVTSLIIIVLTCVVGLLGAGVFRQWQLNNSSADFVLELAPQILNGQPEVLAQHASPQFIEQQPLAVMTRFLNIVTLNMGSADVITSITGSSEVPLLIFSDVQPSASYQLQVEFANGMAQVDALMRYENNTWQFTGFSVISDQLAN